jgi:spore photoproduct lyase
MVKISKLFINKDVKDYELTRSIQTKINLLPIFVDSTDEVYRWVNLDNDPVRHGKEVLYLSANKGQFLKNCPGTKSYMCCGYKILHIGTFCTMDCSYCILQAYFHPPVLQFFVNHNDLESELDRFFELNKTPARIGTGEYTDSLIWERWSNLSEMLVSKFSNQKLSVLELKTKTVLIEKLKNVPHNRKTIIAWSLNTPRVIAQEEKHSAKLKSRLEAAARCESWDYPLAFHFDPLIYYDGCEADYRTVVQQLFATVSPANIVWISLGAFRFMPKLKPIIQKRFPESKAVYGEFVPGLDNKMRYFKPIRMSLYRNMINWIRDAAPNVCVYFCMEDGHIWERCLGFNPDERGGLSQILDERATEVCNLLHCS